MAIRGQRIYHVNSNCSDLDRSVAFYRALGLVPVLRTVPSRSQSGAAFGLADVAWDAWMMHSEDAMAGLSLDLLEWKVPAPTGKAADPLGEPGLNRLVLTSRDLAATAEAAVAAGGRVLAPPTEIAGVDVALLADPDGVPVQLERGDRVSIASVVVNCVDLDRSVAYYRDVMGMSLDGEVALVDRPGALFGRDGDVRVREAVMTDAGSAFTVRLVEWIEPASGRTARVRAANEIGLFRMAWSTEDCAHDEAVVRAAGSTPFAPTAELSVGDELPLLLVLFWPGPDGECLEVIEVTERSGALEGA